VADWPRADSITSGGEGYVADVDGAKVYTEFDCVPTTDLVTPSRLIVEADPARPREGRRRPVR
jgi:hypothetical protein